MHATYENMYRSAKLGELIYLFGLYIDARLVVKL
jgi:hypothetical protein